MGKKLRRFDIFVVVVLSVPLAALLMVLIKGKKNGHAPRDYTLIRMLDMACESYRKQFGEYPPTTQYKDSRALHLHLGSERKLRKKMTDGVEGEWVSKPPLVKRDSGSRS